MFFKKCHIARHRKVCYVILAKRRKTEGTAGRDKKIFQLLVSMIDTEKEKWAFMHQNMVFMGWCIFMPIFGDAAVARKKWQQKSKKERGKK